MIIVDSIQRFSSYYQDDLTFLMNTRASLDELSFSVGFLGFPPAVGSGGAEPR